MIKRFKEASTWGGIAAAILAVGQVSQINEAPAIADAVNNAGAAVAATGNVYMGLGVLLASIAAIFIPEKGNEK